MMPDMDGMQLLNNIKESDELERVPVIMQTAKAASSDVVAGLKAGASYYLTKPYDGEILKSVVRSAVSDRLHEKSLLESLHEGRKTFDLMTFGRFRIHNLHQCNLVATQVAHLCPKPQRVVTGISELLVNALEHELEFKVEADTVQIRIRDQGQGFDWTPYLDFNPERAFEPHGRGIAMARLSSFDDLEYLGDGNEVLATVKKGLDA
jgi:DNA-binding response OmpR family regulator